MKFFFSIVWFESGNFSKDIEIRFLSENDITFSYELSNNSKIPIEMNRQTMETMENVIYLLCLLHLFQYLSEFLFFIERAGRVMCLKMAHFQS